MILERSGGDLRACTPRSSGGGIIGYCIHLTFETSDSSSYEVISRIECPQVIIKQPKDRVFLLNGPLYTCYTLCPRHHGDRLLTTVPGPPWRRPRLVAVLRLTQLAEDQGAADCTSMSRLARSSRGYRPRLRLVLEFLHSWIEQHASSRSCCKPVGPTRRIRTSCLHRGR